jgi:hypothetical protein
MAQKLSGFALFFAIFFSISYALAAPTVVGITGASVVDATPSATIIYGGSAGTACANGTSTCDNCDGSGLTACNHTRITPNTNLTIQLTSTSQTGYVMIGDDATGAQIARAAGVTNQNATGSITITWNDICNKISAGQSLCETAGGGGDLNSAVILRVGIDSSTTPDNKLDGTNDDYIRISFKVQRSMGDTVNLSAEGSASSATNGIVSWSVYPGDGKVYLENVETYPGFPSSANSILYNKLHLLYRAGTCTNVALIKNKMDGSTGTFDLTTGIQSDGNLDDDRFLGLTNDTTYVFKVALEDQAGNIGLFFPNAPCTNETHSVTPSEVFGLLKNQNNCFIATAAYGSPLEKHVKTLRQFRDAVLLKFDLGKLFVRTYYKLSPPVAQVISESPVLRAASQVALFPVWAFAASSALIGFWPSLVILFCLLASALIVLKWSFNKRTGDRA